MDHIVVFSHLRWDFVYQRPQHLMSRFGSRSRVLYFEEPKYCQGDAHIAVTQVDERVFVCTPYTPVASPGFNEQQMPTLRLLLSELMKAQRLRDPMAWLYTPMAVPLLSTLNPSFTVYDCMDELSSFKNAPGALAALEQVLLRKADIVFTGGYSLYKAKCSYNSHTYCFPSSVDSAHFRRALSFTEDHPAQRDIRAPRLGFFGVIDERFDGDLVRDLAQKCPDCQVVLVGPIIKIDPATLPHLPNIHYLGQQTYQALPQLIAGWDVCLLPFALNAATRYISPTKTLEYMAAEKPVVSTPVPDVKRAFGDVVQVAPRSSFAQACREALLEDKEQATARRSAMRAKVDATSWDETVRQMSALIADVKQARAIKPLRPRPQSDEACRVAVVGAGPTGLSAAYHLGEECVLLEQNSTVGGWCRSLVDGGFTFDHAGHIMFSNDTYVHELYRLLLGNNVHWQDREAWIYSKNVFTRYPFQGSLYGLPPEVIAECIVGAVEAQMAARSGRHDSTHSSGMTSGIGKAESITDCCADGTQTSPPLTGITPIRPASPPPPKSFEEFIFQVWGAGIAKHFAIPYNKKLWATPLAEMETSWLGGRVPMPDLREMIQGALQPLPKPLGPNARFGYPLRGGFQALMDGFLPLLRGQLRLGTRVTRINAAEHRCVTDVGSPLRYEQLISTMPLPLLVQCIEDVPDHVREAASKLRHVSVRCVNLGVKRPHLSDKHWIYYPESTVFHRLFMQGNASPHNNAPGGFGVTCEITYSPNKPLPCDGDALIDRCIADCVAVGILRPEDDIPVRNQVDMPYAYVVYDHQRSANVLTVRRWLASQDIFLAGRYSEWEYYNSDHAFVAGRNAADAAQKRATRPLRTPAPAKHSVPSVLN